MFKYPRTVHIEGSRKQAGDEDLDAVPFAEIQYRNLVVEEKVDGANCAISFEDGTLMLQSRGHYLIGNDHSQFDLFKSWAFYVAQYLFPVLGNRYIMFGEWLFAKHTEFYDDLPHYFLEFDIYDQERDIFLDTLTRRQMLESISDDVEIVSVPVLHWGDLENLDSLVSFVGKSRFKTDKNHEHLTQAAAAANVDRATAFAETDISPLMEGLYIKDETSGVVDGRYKWVRADFLQTIKDSGSHWMKRPVVQNRLASGVDLFG